ncbi:MAG: PEP-CTERM sorting domain-containing protein [Phycisphaerales bacterium]|jgi:hypothetical protein|nr:PEP-CTERM sorting domain-containing protein [Phycisphaerales bacterium]
MTKAFAVLAVAGLAAAASAQSGIITITTDAGGPVAPGTIVNVVVNVGYTGVTGGTGVAALRGAVTLPGADSVGGTVENSNEAIQAVLPSDLAWTNGRRPGQFSQASFGQTGYRLTGANDSGAGVFAGGQLSFDAAFVAVSGLPTNNNIDIFKFSFTRNSGGVVDLGFIVANIGVYTNGGPSNQSFTAAQVNGASVTFTPAPSSVALLGLGGLVAGRRRR